MADDSAHDSVDDDDATDADDGADDSAEDSPNDTAGTVKVSPKAAAKAAGTSEGSGRTRQSSLATMGKRYGPFAVVAVVVVAAIAVFGGGGDSEDDADGDGGGAAASSGTYEELVRSGPMTPIKADLTGEEFDAGPNCDEETGRIMLPTVYAPPCVEPFEGDNGGATSPGVTADTIKVVVYQSDPELDPLGAGMIASTGADLSREAITQTLLDYKAVFDTVFETYGRDVEVELFTGTGASDDIEKARSDATAIAEMEPFAVLGGPVQASQAFTDVLAEAGIVSFPPQPLAESYLLDRAPYVWGTTTPNQASLLAAEAIGKLAGPGPAVMAGDPEMREEERVYAVLHYDTPDNEHEESFETLEQGLLDYDIELADDIEFLLEPERLQETARTMIARLKDRGVTTVIFYGDPLTPMELTAEATAQDYHPEWILGPNFLADTATFGRQFDQEQWGNGFGVAIAGTPAAEEVGTAHTIYTWAYDGQEPPSNVYSTIEPGLRTLYTAIQMTGQNLTPETFRDGMYRIPPVGGGPTRPHISRGDHGIWETPDLGATDDIALMWWDPEAEGTNEVGDFGAGMYRFANEGQRYKLGELPSSPEEAGLFDDEASVVEMSDVPPEDEAPDYPPPDL